MAGKESDSRIADYALDHLGDQPMLLLPTHGGKASASAQRRLYKSISQVCDGCGGAIKSPVVALQ